MMKLALMLVAYFAAASMAEECQVRDTISSFLETGHFHCQIYRGAVEKFAAEIASRQVGKQLETRSMQPNLRPL